MNIVKGKNFIIAIKVGSDYLPLFCAKTGEFVKETDIIEVTSVNSGPGREYEPGMYTSTLSCTGIHVLDNTGGNASASYLLQDSVGRLVQYLRITMTDDDSNVVVMDFTAIIKRISLSKDSQNYSQSAADFQITGGVTSTTVIPPNSDGAARLYLSTTPAATSVTSASLIGKTILEVEREGVGYTETSGTPSNREFKFTSGTGNIAFLVPFDSGEIVYVLYQ